MNAASLLILLLLLAGVWFAIRTLRRNDGHPCSCCRGGAACCQCGKKRSRCD